MLGSLFNKVKGFYDRKLTLNYTKVIVPLRICVFNLNYKK